MIGSTRKQSIRKLVTVLPSTGVRWRVKPDRGEAERISEAENKTKSDRVSEGAVGAPVAMEGPPTEDLGRGPEALLSRADWVVWMVYRIDSVVYRDGGPGVF